MVLQKPEASAAPPLPGQRYVVLVTQARLLMQQPCPPPGSMPPEAIAPIERIAPAQPRLNIAVIAFTALDALLEDIARAIPFLGYLLGLAYLGHKVVIFEGHPSALAAGCYDADLLLIDGAMAPFLPDNLIELVYPVMRVPRILAVGRNGKITEISKAPREEEYFHPYMPDVQVLSDIEQRFALARQAAAGNGQPPDPAHAGQHLLVPPETSYPDLAEEAGNTRFVVLVMPDRQFWRLSCPTPQLPAPAPLRAIEKLAPPQPALNITVIAFTYRQAIRRDIRRAMPFLDQILHLGYLGHRVVICEGHPSALVAACRDTDLVLVDEAMAPHLPSNLPDVLRPVMRPIRIVGVTRDGELIEICVE